MTVAVGPCCWAAAVLLCAVLSAVGCGAAAEPAAGEKPSGKVEDGAESLGKAVAASAAESGGASGGGRRAESAAERGAAGRHSAARVADADSAAAAGTGAQQHAAEPAAADATPRQGAAAAQAGRHANRLARETSPYLLLHAHNPVDWYPWGEEALERARAEGKLIFLSIGYSSCYWCHVMERESFMDEEVAAYLNEHFVCIKVDREERPDIDELYMTALSLLGRRGGWPLTMILTPEALPIYGGTYFPPRDRLVVPPGGEAERPQRLPGLLSLLRVVREAWEEKPAELRQGAEQLAAAVRRVLSGPPGLAARPPHENIAELVVAELAARYDERHGGFSGGSFDQPKFPEPSNLTFLLDLAEHEGHVQARRMLEGTLNALAAGGIRDHLGGGFHRYSTEPTWSVPHFEKMLYDNAQLASLFARAYALWQDEEHRRVVEELVAFMLREMQSPQGGFYSAIDAETNGEEGAYYVWSAEELRGLIPPEEWAAFAAAYSLDGEPTFEGRYVLRRPQGVPAQEAAAGDDVTQHQKFVDLRRRLLAAREERERPLVDVKVLCGWNGLAIRGLADAGRCLRQSEYVDAAARAAEFVLSQMRTAEGRLLRVHAGGQAHGTAFLDDYALLIDGLLALHEATGDARWLAEARSLQQQQIELFWDHAGGGFFYTPSDHEALFARSKDPVDSALPSGNAVSASNLAYLGRVLGDAAWQEQARQTVLAFSSLIENSPAAMPRLVQAWLALKRG